MITNSARSLAVLAISTLITAVPTLASDSGKYGKAPPSLDFPTAYRDSAAADLRKEATLDVKKNSWAREELSYLSPINPFPSDEVPEKDPVTGKKFDAVKIGPAFKGRAAGGNYDYYRYVTYYNISIRKERVYEFPIQRAQCYDNSDLFASNNLSVSYSSTVNASVSFEGLGLGASFTDSRTFGSGHMTAAAGGMVADYIPYALKQDWEGFTYIQLLDSKTGKTDFVREVTQKSPWWYYLLWPYAVRRAYPMPFEVRDADWTFTVERKIIEYCTPTFNSD